LEPSAGGDVTYQQHDANACAVFGMVCHWPGHAGWALQPGERQRGCAAPHARAARADCHEIHETAATLLATLGQPIFEPLTNVTIGKEDKGLFYCKGAGADAVGEYTTEGFVVLNGSRACSDGVELNDTPATEMRGVLMAQGVLRMLE
jgi:hypothetical protein